MGSQDELVSDLMRKPRDAFRDQLVAAATEGRYHDFKSSHATPKLLLVHDLERYGYRDLARKAKRGGYDDRPDAEDQADLDGVIANNPKLAAAWAEMEKTNDPEKAFAVIAEQLSPEEQAAARAELGPSFFMTRKP